jgi:pyridoxamine 5'-phosphate oxidase
MADDPHSLFESWLAEARQSEINDSNAMALATANEAGQPSVRMVLLKGNELEANPQAALLFHWKSLRRQVRIDGAVQPVSAQEADAYFASRSRDSQLGAWASDQSRPLLAREVFEQRYEEARCRFEGSEVPRPPRWSGYRVVPERIEFWSDREHRLHERRLFTLHRGAWSEGLLYP